MSMEIILLKLLPHDLPGANELTSFINAAIDYLQHNYRKTSSISRTKYQNLNVSCFLLQWSLPNPLKPGVKLRMKM